MGELNQIGTTLIVIGLLLAAVGVFLTFAGRISWLGQLPGDIYIKGDNYTFYFPITTCILLSILFSIVLYLARLLG